MIIPLSKAQQTLFTPESFANMAEPPRFRFRAPSPIDREDYRYALREAGLRFHAREEFHAEIIKGMTEMWAGDADVLAGNIARLEAFWQLEDQAEQDPTLSIDEQEQMAVRELLMQLMNAWPPLNRMNADNLKFAERAPKVALRMYLAGWQGIDLPFRLIAGQVPMESIFELEKAITAIEERAQADHVEGVIPSVGFTELTAHAIGLMDLGLDTEKNSPSPSASSGDQNGSMEPSPQESPSPSTATRSRRDKTQEPA